MNSTFAQLMDEETTRVRSRKAPVKSWHEGYGLIAEEFDEFWDEVKKKSEKRDRDNALKELVQIAALCQRIAIDLALVDDYERKNPAVPPDNAALVAMRIFTKNKERDRVPTASC